MDSADSPSTCFTLNNGYKMPAVGLGTFRMSSSDDVYTAVAEIGYRHIDTASKYQTEEMIGQALQKIFKETDIKREDLFITTKIWGDEKDDVEGALKKSLEKLQLEYVDLYLIHWPVAFKKDDDGKCILAKIPISKTWSDMENLVNKGLTKSIGVSNFNVQNLIDLLSYCEIKPVCNQIELHPYLVQDNLVTFLKKNDIIPVAYCPLIRAGQEDLNAPKGVFELDIFKELAEKYQKTVGQIVLNWGLQRGHSIIPKSSKKNRLIENLESTSFTLDQEDVDKITALNQNFRCCSSSKFKFTLHHDIFA